MELDIKKKHDISVSNDENYDWNEMGICSKVKYVFQNITVEPILMFFQVSFVISSLTTQNLNLQKACRVNLKLEDKICYALENRNTSFFPNEERQVQQLVSDMLIWQTVIQSSIPCVLVIFVGSWSDRNKKRKPCMLFPIIGEIIKNIGLLLCVVYFKETTMEVSGLVASIPSSVAGGLTIIYLAASSYIGDTSSVKNRTLRVGLMNLLFGAAWPIGATLTGILVQKLGFISMYYLSTTLYIFSLLYGLIRIKEHPGYSERKNFTETPDTWMYLLTDFFNLKHIKEALYVTFKKGSEQRRYKIIILLCVVALVQGPVQGEGAVGYLYARLRLNWNEVDYSFFSAFTFSLNIIGIGFSLGVLSHMCKMDDAVIGVTASVSKILASIVYAFAETQNAFYFGGMVDMMSSASFIVVRSILSKIIPNEELGQVSAVIAVIETMAPVIYKPLYSAVYRVTLNTFPGAFHIFGSIMFAPSIFLYMWMYRMKNYENKEK